MSARPSMADRVKATGIVSMRKFHRHTLEQSSVRSFRRRRVATSPPPRLEPAALHYKGVSWLPSDLLVPEKLPREAGLPVRYAAPYYALGKIGWWLYGRRPLNPDVPWDPSLRWNTAFPDGPRAWGDPADDDTFTRLRLQGPNPFMLTRVDPDPALDDEPDELVFDLDFTQLFDGVFTPVVARFAVRDGSLVPAWIRIGDDVRKPGHPAWVESKRVVNALDARYAAFVRHLLNTHLMVGEAYAVAAYTLPVFHPLRAFMDFFSYGALYVNDLAYRALLTPDSYFLRSNFVSPDDARRLMQNATTVFDFDEWIVPRDLAKRQLELIPDHPYVEDALTVWPAIERVVRRHLDDLDFDDEFLATDHDMAAWYATLRKLLPDADSIPPMDDVEDLIDLLTALIYNNVIHEVCGNLSPILDSRDPADKAGIDLDHLRAMIDPERETPVPRAGDVFLMDQASYVSQFNVAGNNLMTINAARFVDDPKLRIAIEELQATLRVLDDELAARNRRRLIPFDTMQPHKWEASISF
jgi:lipoxygenase